MATLSTESRAEALPDPARLRQAARLDGSSRTGDFRGAFMSVNPSRHTQNPETILTRKS